MRNVAALLSLVVAMSASAAQADPLDVLAPRADVASSGPTASERQQKIVGTVLVTTSALTSVAATFLGVSYLAEGLCGIDGGNSPDGCVSQDRAGMAMGRAAIGLAVTSAIASAVGIPLLVAGTNAEKARKLRLSAAPVVTQGGGMTASFSMRF